MASFVTQQPRKLFSSLIVPSICLSFYIFTLSLYFSNEMKVFFLLLFSYILVIWLALTSLPMIFWTLFSSPFLFFLLLCRISVRMKWKSHLEIDIRSLYPEHTRIHVQTVSFLAQIGKLFSLAAAATAHSRVKSDSLFSFPSSSSSPSFFSAAAAITATVLGSIVFSFKWLLFLFVRKEEEKLRSDYQAS